MADPPTAVTCGSVITAPGDYYLAGDCTGPGITINASGVHLKLDRHTMIGLGPIGGLGLGAFNVSNVHIEGPGTITNYFSNIYFSGVSDSHVEQVTSVNSGGDGFILLSSTNIHANNNVFSMNGRAGVFLQTNSNDNHLNNNQTNGNRFIGIRVVSGSSNHINGNTALGNPAIDLDDDNANCDDNKWNGNTFNTANQPCIH
jgi:parallel beta-helix repeat protein